MENETDKTANALAGCVILCVALLSGFVYQPLFAVVIEHAWLRWAVPAGAPSIPWTAFWVLLLLRSGLPKRARKAEDDPSEDRLVASAVVYFLFLGFTAAVVWGVP